MIGASAFRGSAALKTAKLPQVTSVGSNAFNGCTSLTRVELPQAASLGTSAFGGAAALEELVLGSVPPKVTATHFAADCPKKLYIPASALDAYLAADFWKKMPERIYLLGE
jgi:hypothetical protein